jgi:hypothetical protein
MSLSRFDFVKLSAGGAFGMALAPQVGMASPWTTMKGEVVAVSFADALGILQFFDQKFNSNRLTQSVTGALKSLGSNAANLLAVVDKKNQNLAQQGFTDVSSQPARTNQNSTTSYEHWYYPALTPAQDAYRAPFFLFDPATCTCIALGDLQHLYVAGVGAAASLAQGQGWTLQNVKDFLLPTSLSPIYKDGIQPAPGSGRSAVYQTAGGYVAVAASPQGQDRSGANLVNFGVQISRDQQGTQNLFNHTFSVAYGASVTPS